MQQKEMIKSEFRECIENNPCENYTDFNEKLEIYEDIIKAISELPNIIKDHINGLLRDENLFGKFKSNYKLIREDCKYNIKRFCCDKQVIEELYTLSINEKLMIVDFFNKEDTLNSIQNAINYYNNLIVKKAD